MKQKRLTAFELTLLALEKKCVSIPYCNIKCMPAAFLICMQFNVVIRYVERGVYEYKPKAKSKAPWPKGEMIKSDF